ncbi:MAG: hypothetical protein WD649_02670 [Thermoleophilaceae bacterium]
MHGERRRIRQVLDKAFKGPEEWLVFTLVAERLGLRELDRWIERTWPITAAQMPLKRYPTTTGALETKLRTVRARLLDRRFNFTNRARLDRLLMLMQLDINGHAVERRYAQLIREHLVKHGGIAPVRWQIADKRGVYSLRAQLSVNARTKRRQHRRAKAKRRSGKQAASP